MHVCIDVAYLDNAAVAAALAFAKWNDPVPTKQSVSHITGVDSYIPGEFYRRELPCILAAIEPFVSYAATIVVDGYVELGDKRPGLGLKLFETLAGRVPVVGVAKTAFHGADNAVKLFRGGSRRPLFITAVGLSSEEAAQYIHSMHGPFRIPTLLKLADHIARREIGNH